MKKILLVAVICLILLLSTTSVHAEAAETPDYFARIFGGNDVVMLLTGPQTGSIPAAVLYSGLAAVIVALLILTGILVRILRKLKHRNREIDNLYELRKAFIDADDRIVYLKDENYRYIFVNKAMEAFYQKDSPEIIGKDDYSLTDKDFADMRRKTDEEAMKKGERVLSEVRFDGRVYKANKFPIKLLNGHYGIGAYIEDVTDDFSKKKKEEQTLLRNSILVDVFSRDFNTAEEQLEYVLDKALKLTGSELGYICLYDEENRKFTLCTRPQGFSGNLCQGDEAAAAGGSITMAGLLQEAVRTRIPVVMNDLEDWEEPGDCPAGQARVKKCMVVPVKIENRIPAAILLANKEADYDEDDARQITILMTGVWNAKERRERSLQLEKAYSELTENKDKLQLILDSTAEAIYGMDTRGICTFCNASCARMLGYDEPSELIGKNMHARIHHSYNDGRPVPAEECRILKALETGEGTRVEDEVFWRKDGTSFDVEYFSYPQYKDGVVVGAVVTFIDITERKKAEAKIKYLSIHDPLTDLYNRMFFEEELARFDRQEEYLPVSIIMGDVNGLKLTNDVFGHAAGDALLMSAATVFRRHCRPSDVICRIGGDEFVIFMPNTAKTEAESIMNDIREDFSREKISAVRGSISMGVGEKASMEQDLNMALETAEYRMYREKTLNRRGIDIGFVRDIMDTLFEVYPQEVDHSRAVSGICRDIAVAMGLPDAEVKRIIDAGEMHDIGKIAAHDGTPVSGDLSDEGAGKEMRQHPAIGYRILNSLESTADLAEIVLAHHERWDGAGYPKGLRGEEIPLASRIIAVAERFDHLTRRLGKTDSEAEDIIRSQSGQAFDPRVVNAFLKARNQA
jgi:diguanylate cyclase (GGDEF)-like protein/PAS domain S-box-containing protein